MTTKHTNGKWYIAYNAIKSEDGRNIAVIDESCTQDYEGENMPRSFANSSLIAAAPELARELENLIEICEVHAAGIVRKRDINSARAALKAAKGE